MPSFLTIDFDTTSPQIEIRAPRYTTKDEINEIVIESNERLANFQDVYAIDRNGIRHDYNFQQTQDNQFVGLIRFNDFPIGITTVYARMKDDVDNYSDLAHKSIEIKESLTSLNLKISEKHRLINEENSVRKVVVESNIRNTNINSSRHTHK